MPCLDLPVSFCKSHLFSFIEVSRAEFRPTLAQTCPFPYSYSFHRPPPFLPALPSPPPALPEPIPFHSFLPHRVSSNPQKNPEMRMVMMICLMIARRYVAYKNHKVLERELKICSCPLPTNSPLSLNHRSLGN